VVPTKAMGLLERNLQDDAEEPIKVCLRPNDVLFRTGRAVIYSKLVEGRFPDYRAVMPKKKAETVHLNPNEFQAAVRQAAIMTETDNRRVTFKFAKGKLTLLATGAMAGRSRIEMPLAYEGKGIDINFNPDYLTEMLKVLPTDATLTLDIIDGQSSAVFRSGEGYTYLVMPLT
jgi:DNA polymerase-3 subunit beta